MFNNRQLPIFIGLQFFHVSIFASDGHHCPIASMVTHCFIHFIFLFFHQIIVVNHYHLLSSFQCLIILSLGHWSPIFHNSNASWLFHCYNLTLSSLLLKLRLHSSAGSLSFPWSAHNSFTLPVVWLFHWFTVHLLLYHYFTTSDDKYKLFSLQIASQSTVVTFRIFFNFALLLSVKS